MKKNIIVITSIISFLLVGCMANLQTKTIKKEGIQKNNIEKGKAILFKVWKNQGFDKLNKHSTYSFNAQDSWKGLMGEIGKPWPDNQMKIAFKYEIGTFNSQLEFLSDDKKDEIFGLQNWKYYKIKNDSIQFLEKTNKKFSFGLSAYQYFMELTDRLIKAPIISYAGTKTINDQIYDLVFITWDKSTPHKEHDQYLLWINQKSNMLTYAEFTIRDNYLKFPGSSIFYGSIKYSDFKSIDGILIPHKQTVFFNSPKSKESKHLHQLILTDFKFDEFDIKVLHPNSKLRKMGDEKLQHKS